MAYAMYREASGESYSTQRAVLDVIHHRVVAEHKKPCDILKEHGQFPWAKYGFKEVDLKFKVRYTIVDGMEEVVDEDVLFFNEKPLSFGRSTKKIGHIYFSK